MHQGTHTHQGGIVIVAPQGTRAAPAARCGAVVRTMQGSGDDAVAPGHQGTSAAACVRACAACAPGQCHHARALMRTDSCVLRHAH